MATVAEVEQEITDAQGKLEAEEEKLGTALATGKKADALESKCEGLRKHLRQLDLKRDAAQKLADEAQADADHKEACKMVAGAVKYRDHLEEVGSRMAALVAELNSLADELGSEHDLIGEWQRPLREASKLAHVHGLYDEKQPALKPLTDRGGLIGEAQAAARKYAGIRDAMQTRHRMHLR